MENKNYLDLVGLQLLVDWINLQLKGLKNEQDLVFNTLYNTDGTPGSIQQIVEDTLRRIDVFDLLQNDFISLYGGSATNVIDNELIVYGGSAVTNDSLVISDNHI